MTIFWECTRPDLVKDWDKPLAIPIEYGNPVYKLYWQSEIPGPIVEAVKDERVFCAHNCIGFDGRIWEAKLSPVPRHWYDSIYAARASGLPGALDQIGHRLLGAGKHEARQLVSELFTCRRQKDGRLAVKVPINKIGLARLLLTYNLCDVAILARLWQELANQDLEDKLVAVNELINERGIGFDSALASTICDLSEATARRATEEICRVTSGELCSGKDEKGKDRDPRTDIRSNPRMTAWLAKEGVVLPNLRRDTIRQFLDDPEEMLHETGARAIKGSVSPIVFQVLRLRTAALRITSGKLNRARIVSDEDGRLRDLLVYWGAHTGRWASRIVQVHNLPRPVRGVDVEQMTNRGALTAAILDTVTEKIREKLIWAAPDDILSSLIRSTLVPAPGYILLIADYASIEARGVAWVASECKLLDVFNRNGDVYCDFGSMMFGRPITKADDTERQVAKVTVLGAGYSLGHEKFALYAAAQGVDLESAGTTAEKCIKSYRQSYPYIPMVWKAYDAAAREALTDRDIHRAGRCLFMRDGKHLICQLPSGREIVYRDARLEERTPLWALQRGLQFTQPTVVYTGSRGESVLYGGKITENVVQGLCRDLLAESLMKCEEAGLRPVLHVHDEIVCEVPIGQAESALAQLLTIMSTPPLWARAFPVGVEGYWNERYAKKPFGGRKPLEYFNGKPW